MLGSVNVFIIRSCLLVISGISIKSIRPIKSYTVFLQFFFFVILKTVILDLGPFCTQHINCVLILLIIV